MTWMQALWAVDGNPLPGQFWRLQLAGSAMGAQGIVNPTDCKVTASSPASSIVHVGAGGVIVAGAESPQQGAYSGLNVGDDPISISPTSGSGRSDLVVARVEDPTAPGTAWGHSAATDQLIYSRVISGVPNTTTDVPGGVSGVALARIDIPASTSAITSAMIKDLRYLVSPIRVRNLLVNAYNGATDTMYDSRGSYADWPSGFSWSVAVPIWAKRLRFLAYVAQMKVNVNVGSPGGYMRLRFGSLFSQAVVLNANTGGNYRFTPIVGDSGIDITSLAGTTVTAAIQGVGNGGGSSGFFLIDNWCALALDYEFMEVPI